MNKESELNKQIENLEEALRFYANSDNYLFTGGGKGLVIPEEESQSLIARDMGNKASKALSKKR